MDDMQEAGNSTGRYGTGSVAYEMAFQYSQLQLLFQYDLRYWVVNIKGTKQPHRNVFRGTTGHLRTWYSICLHYSCFKRNLNVTSKTYCNATMPMLRRCFSFDASYPVLRTFRKSTHALYSATELWVVHIWPHLSSTDGRNRQVTNAICVFWPTQSAG